MWEGRAAMRVMIIEDEKRARAVIRNLVLAVDPTVQIVGECSNGMEGLEMIPKMLPDLVFVDIRMPGMSGLEMIRHLSRKHVKTEYVVITGYSDFRYAKEGIDLGVSGYVLKPVTYEDITKTGAIVGSGAGLFDIRRGISVVAGLDPRNGVEA